MENNGRRQRTGVVRSQSVEEISTHILKLKDSRLEMQRRGEGLGYSGRDLDKALRKLLDGGSRELPRPNKRSSENQDKRVDDLIKRLRVMEDAFIRVEKLGPGSEDISRRSCGPLGNQGRSHMFTLK